MFDVTDPDLIVLPLNVDGVQMEVLADPEHPLIQQGREIPGFLDMFTATIPDLLADAAPIRNGDVQGSIDVVNAYSSFMFLRLAAA